ncbi:hypothetical protein [Hymenobacter sp. BT190]|uniref:hypothetical protein n=1 Tax=Hymenobacter sp. BT190 TaxID=2763505 RepID=UPI001651393B|nr:hypothetical protein [Hymenobacter sp. BT190]MBC6698059.1 hypothetical protein [Hymenobacter sp. BT190]
MEQTEDRIRPIKENLFQVTIDRLVGEARDSSLRESIKRRICSELGITKRYTMLLNNTLQPSMKDLLTFSQVLGVPMDSLIVLEKAV